MATRDILYDQAMTCLERFADAESKCAKRNDELLTKLQEQMAYFCNSKARYEAIESIYADSLEEVKNAKSAEDAKNICASFEKKVKDTEQLKGTLDQRYIDFVSLCGVDGEDLDEDIRMVKSSKNVIDPISKQRMVDPVKNTQCGHSYEKNVVLQLIKMNPRMRCPIVGCSAKNYIEKSILVPDDGLKRYLAMSKNQSISEAEDSQIVLLDETQ